jgi:hypothetical protein
MEHCPDFQLWILCMDDQTHEILNQMSLANVRSIRLSQLEDQFPELLKAKKNRSRIEYYFTCTPALPLFVLNCDQMIDAVTYLDADLFFFSDIAPLYREIGEHSIAIIEHRFPDAISEFAQHGIFNVGFLFFRRDNIGLACLRRWFEQCLEWCYDRVEGNRFADQKYLDDWPTRFENLIVLQHKGANLAPWNLSKYSVTSRARQVQIDGQPLIFFHFHNLKRIADWLYEPNLENYKATMSRVILKRIYKVYLRAISRIARRNTNLTSLSLRDNIRIPNPESSGASRTQGARSLARVKGALTWRIEVVRRIYQGSYIVFFGGSKPASH